MVQEQDSTTQVTMTVTTSEQSQRQLPPWLAETVVVLKVARDHGLLSGIQEKVRVARGRMGLFGACDFLLMLLWGSAASAWLVDDLRYATRT